MLLVCVHACLLASPPLWRIQDSMGMADRMLQEHACQRLHIYIQAGWQLHVVLQTGGLHTSWQVLL